MSSLPLISHHLFVAAVKAKACPPPVRGRSGARGPTPEVQVSEIPVELVDFGRPLPVEAVSPFDAFPLARYI